MYKNFPIQENKTYIQKENINKNIKHNMIWNTKVIDFVNENLNSGIIFLKVNPFYKGMQSLRKPHLKYGYTDEEHKIMDKCSDFMEFFRTVDEDLFNRNATNDLAQTMHKNRFLQCLNYRTEIFEKVAAVKLLHDMTYNDAKTYVVASKKYTGCEKIVSHVKEYYKRLPFFMKRGLVAWNQKSIKFDNGCKLRSSIISENVCVGFNIDGLVTHDMVFMSDKTIKRFNQTLQPVMNASKNSYMYHISTNSHKRSLFHDMLQDDKNAYIKKIYPLRSDKNSKVDKDEMIKILGEKSFGYEYDLEIPEKSIIDKKSKNYTIKLINEDGKETVFNIATDEDLKKHIKALQKNLNQLNQL